MAVMCNIVIDGTRWVFYNFLVTFKTTLKIIRKQRIISMKWENHSYFPLYDKSQISLIFFKALLFYIISVDYSLRMGIETYTG